MCNPPVKRRGPRLVWIWGPPGCGKSYLAGITVPKMLGIDVVRKDPFTKWWPSNIKSDYVLIEDIDASFFKDVGFSSLKIWGDEYPFQAEIKGA